MRPAPATLSTQGDGRGSCTCRRGAWVRYVGAGAAERLLVSVHSLPQTIDVNLCYMDVGSAAKSAHDVGLAATRFHRSMKNAVGAALEPFELTGAEYGALLFLDRNPGTSNADLARFLIISPQALGRLTSRMQEQGLLLRDAGHVVGRRQPFSLTVIGADLLRRAEPDVEAAQQTLLSPLSPEEQRSFLHALDACSTPTENPRKDPT